LKDQTLPVETPTTPATTDPSSEPIPNPNAPPESYSFKAPEGKELDKTFLDTATPVFKELGLSQDKAQKLVDTYNKLSDANAAKLQADVKTMQDGWQNEVKAKYGVQLDEKLAEFGRFKDIIFADDKAARTKFEKALDLTGGGNHPDIVEGLIRAASKFTEGKHVSGAGPSPEGQRAPGKPAAPSAAQAMWPGLPSSNAA
jgi:hypothetical protein